MPAIGGLQDILNDALFSLNSSLSGGHQALFTNCKCVDWDPAVKVKDLIGVKLKFTAGSVAIT